MTESKDSKKQIQIQTSQKIGDELYGKLLAANEKISTGSGWIMILSLLIGPCLSVLLYLGYIEKFLHTDLSAWKGWWIYPIICFATFVALGVLSDINEKIRYLFQRKNLRNALSQHGTNKHTLISQIQADLSLKTVNKFLKKDSSL